MVGHSDVLHGDDGPAASRFVDGETHRGRCKDLVDGDSGPAEPEHVVQKLRQKITLARADFDKSPRPDPVGDFERYLGDLIPPELVVGGLGRLGEEHEPHEKQTPSPRGGTIDSRT